MPRPPELTLHGAVAPLCSRNSLWLAQQLALDWNGEGKDKHAYTHKLSAGWLGSLWRNQSNSEAQHIYYIQPNGEAALSQKPRKMELLQVDKEAGFMVYSWIKERGLVHLGKRG